MIENILLGITFFILIPAVAIFSAAIVKDK
jgi:hypothetical protein